MKDCYPILIEGAMDCELSYFLSCLENIEEEQIVGFDYYKGTIKDVSVILVQTKVGVVNTTAATIYGIQKFQPGLVISQGTAGAHNLDLKKGDIVLGEKMICFDGGSWKWKDSFSSDVKLLEIAEKTKYTHGDVIRGIIGTSMSWNKDINKIKQVRKDFNTDCEEMETWAAAQMCAELGIPFLGLRVISNSELTGDEFEEIEAEHCQKFVMDFLESLNNDF